MGAFGSFAVLQGLLGGSPNLASMADELVLCPRCTGQALQPKLFGSSTLDTCPGCAGMWLDSQELTSLVGAWKDQPRSSNERPASELLCPRCCAPLQRRDYSDKRQTVIDQCPACQGVWLDRGELEAILQDIYGRS